MNLKPTLHNLVVIVLLATLGRVVAKAAYPMVQNIPILGSAVGLIGN